MRLLTLLLLAAGVAQAEDVVERKAGLATARFEAPTDRYGHSIMGDLPEWGRLCLANAGQVACVDLPETSVFEDIEPRLVDVDGDQWMEAVVVESSVSGGAALVVYALEGGKLVRTATPEIGRRNRWLAPVGVADFDGDGRMEIAYVETPHLGKVLRVWRWEDGRLAEVAAASGVTNHRIGEPFITGGVRMCGDGPEMVLADGTWQSVLAVRLEDGGLQATRLGAFSRQRVKEAMACE